MDLRLSSLSRLFLFLHTHHTTVIIAATTTMTTVTLIATTDPSEIFPVLSFLGSGVVLGTMQYLTMWPKTKRRFKSKWILFIKYHLKTTVKKNTYYYDDYDDDYIIGTDCTDNKDAYIPDNQ